MKSVESLDALGYNKWQRGFCHIYAEALRDYMDKGEFVCLWVDGGFAHIYLKIGDLCYDSENKGVPESQLQQIWIDKRQHKNWPINFAVGKSIQEFSTKVYFENGVKFGDTAMSDAYDGPERGRLFIEARALIAADPFYQTLKQKG